MVRGRGQNGEQPENDQNGNLAAILANIQHRLEKQALMMQQQFAVIQNLQQQQFNGGVGDEGISNGGPGIGGIPIGGGHGPGRDPQITFERQEPDTNDLAA